jgi:hypothetical protein
MKSPMSQQSEKYHVKGPVVDGPFVGGNGLFAALLARSDHTHF